MPKNLFWSEKSQKKFLIFIYIKINNKCSIKIQLKSHLAECLDFLTNKSFKKVDLNIEYLSALTVKLVQYENEWNKISTVLIVKCNSFWWRCVAW